MKCKLMAVLLAGGVTGFIFQGQGQAAPYAPAPQARPAPSAPSAPSAPGQSGTLPPGSQGNPQLPPALAAQGVVVATNAGVPSVPRFNIATNQVGQVPTLTNQSGMLTNQFGLFTNQFGLLTNQQGMLTNQFGVETNQFGIFSNRFSVLSNRFAILSNRFGMLSNRFPLSTNFAFLTNQFGTNMVLRDEALTEQDRALVRQIRQELLPEIRRERAAIHLISRNGVVTLVGLVPSDEEEREFVSIVRRTPGVVDVINQLQVAFSMSGSQTAPGPIRTPVPEEKLNFHQPANPSGAGSTSTFTPTSRTNAAMRIFPTTNGVPPRP